MAEDFYAAFGLGESERALAGVDRDGVALAAIQGLNARPVPARQHADTGRRLAAYVDEGAASI